MPTAFSVPIGATVLIPFGGGRGGSKIDKVLESSKKNLGRKHIGGKFVPP
jgi:hypothetical protein